MNSTKPPLSLLCVIFITCNTIILSPPGQEQQAVPPTRADLDSPPLPAAAVVPPLAPPPPASTPESTTVKSSKSNTGHHGGTPRYSVLDGSSHQLVLPAPQRDHFQQDVDHDHQLVLLVDY
mmetsp:Transcript_23916/g.51655  ORF Transcript_23916/g.51655 Transcript_23916/m.51655 type:complete len:121 (+) Transcript_23916:78-440(+)